MEDCPYVAWAPGLVAAWVPKLVIAWAPGLVVVWAPGLVVAWAPGLVVAWPAGCRNNSQPAIRLVLGAASMVASSLQNACWVLQNAEPG